MLLFVDEVPDNEEELLAGLRPLPVNRMTRQAGRTKNQSPSGRNAGSMMFSRKGRTRLTLDKNEVETLLRSDPQFKASYENQIIKGKDDKLTDKYKLLKGPNGGVTGSQFKPYEAGGTIQREGMSRQDLNDQTIQRQQKAKDAINDWDPIEASAREDFNRMKGGRRGPIIGPGAADELIHTIETPIAPATSIGDLKYGI